MKTTFEPWLDHMDRAGKGGRALVQRGERGRTVRIVVNLDGDWTGATLRGEVRISPDAIGDPIAPIIFSPPVVVGGVSTFVGTIASATVFPAPAPGEEVAAFPFDLLFKPAGEEEALLIGSALEIAGRVTAPS